MMERIKKIRITPKGLLTALLLALFAIPSWAQQAVGCFTSTGRSQPCGSRWTDSHNGVAYDCFCNCSRTPPADCTTKSSSGSSTVSADNVFGSVFQNVLDAIINNNTANKQAELDAKQKAAELAAQQAAEQKRIEEAKAQADYEKMMSSYKRLDDSRDLKIKPLGNSNLGFKTLDGDDEKLAADARKQFENTSIAPVTSSSLPGNATPFFGDTMPLADIQTLIEPENNPNIVDLRDATTYVAENIKKDSLGIVTVLRKYETVGNGEPIIAKPDCKKLEQQLEGYIEQREKFQKTINLSQNEVDTWETANRNALINAATDGLEYFTGELLEGMTNRGKAADRLQRIYDKNVQQMVSKGIKVSDIQAKIDVLRSISSAGQIAEFATNMNDWQGFIKDGLSSLVARLSDSNSEIKDMLEDPKMQEFFETEKPELNTLLDISKIAASSGVFGKWVARKIPVVACLEISTKQAYNGLDYFLSLSRILEAKDINGNVMASAKVIQKNIDNLYTELRDCQ
jgi:hypothetical protein